MNKFSLSFADVLVKNNIIPEDLINIYAYGIRAFVTKLSFTITICIIAMILGVLPFSIVFLISLSIIRAYYGKYHAKTRVNCFICSLSIYFICLWLSRNITIACNLTELGLALTFLVILINVVKIADPSKSREENKRKKVGHIGKSILLYLFFFVFYCLNFKEISYGIFFGFLSTVYMECLGLFFFVLESINCKVKKTEA